MTSTSLGLPPASAGAFPFAGPWERHPPTATPESKAPSSRTTHVRGLIAVPSLGPERGKQQAGKCRKRHSVRVTLCRKRQELFLGRSGVTPPPHYPRRHRPRRPLRAGKGSAPR